MSGVRSLEPRVEARVGRDEELDVVLRDFERAGRRRAIAVRVSRAVALATFVFSVTAWKVTVVFDAFVAVPVGLAASIVAFVVSFRRETEAS